MSPHTDRHELVRRANLHMVLQAIVEHAPVSRLELAELTGLSKPTVLNLVDELSAERLIRGSVHSTGTVGRSPQRYELDPTAGYVVGVDLGGSKARAAVADLSGAILHELEERTTTAGGPALTKQLDELVRRVVRESSAKWRRVRAVTIGSPGVVESDGTVNLAANIPGLDALPLGPGLQRRLRRPVIIENDVNIAAIGELAAGAARECATFVVVSIGTGIGAGIVVARRLITGAHGAAGEVAYLPIGADPASPAGHRRGALEVAASGSGIQAILADELRSRTPSELTDTTLRAESTAREVFDAASALDDQIARAVVARHARIVASAILAITAVIDPEMVVLAGGIGSNPGLLDPVRSAVAEVAPFPIRVETSLLGHRAGVIGAVADARRRAWEHLFDCDPLAVERPWDHGPTPVIPTAADHVARVNDKESSP